MLNGGIVFISLLLICIVLAWLGLTALKNGKTFASEAGEANETLLNISKAINAMNTSAKAEVDDNLLVETLNVFEKTGSAPKTLVFTKYFNFVQFMDGIDEYFDNVVLRSSRTYNELVRHSGSFVYEVQKGPRILTLGIDYTVRTEFNNIQTPIDPDHILYLKGMELLHEEEEGTIPCVLVIKRVIFISTIEGSEVKEKEIKSLLTQSELIIGRVINRGKIGLYTVTTNPFGDPVLNETKSKALRLPDEVGVTVHFHGEEIQLNAGQGIDLTKQLLETSIKPNLLINSKKVGSGKTSFMAAIAEEMMVNHLCISITSQRVHDLLADPAFYELLTSYDGTKIIFIDECDFIYQDDKFMSTLKPFMSGIEKDRYDVQFVMVTELPFDKLPEAITRPGRGDFRVTAEYIKEKDVNIVAQRMAATLNDPTLTVNKKQLERIVGETANSPAHFATVGEVASSIGANMPQMLDDIARNIVRAAKDKAAETISGDKPRVRPAAASRAAVVNTPPAAPKRKSRPQVQSKLRVKNRKS